MILMAAGFLTGCMETSEDDCIVKEKETETGERIRSYSSGTEAVENVSVAEKVRFMWIFRRVFISRRETA